MSGSVNGVPQVVLDQQIKASDPGVSAFVSANAGAGKTHVLAQRVIRLLLDGCDPSRILCLTFTKAAAANMAKRVFDILAQWTILDDGAIDQAVRSFGGTPDAELRVRARQLFAAALETPGGLKVQTIHAFCTRLLHQFPFEANVAARFTVLEERAETELIDKLRLDVLMEAAARPDSALGRALAVAITAAADTTFSDVVRETIAKRDAVTAWIDHAGGVDGAAVELARTLGIDPSDTAEQVDADFLNGSILPRSEWAAIASALGEGLKSDRDQAARFAALSRLAGRAAADVYQQIFCTSALEPRKNVVTKTIRDNEPRLAARLAAEQERVLALLDRRRAVAARDRTVALITVAHEVITRYRDEKERRGLLDYADLIDKTLALFGRVSAAWVLYKLDLGIDHVLIDEAQDTSERQWEVIKAVVSEFTAGEGARAEVKRTIFAVGDEKQSIFSFQGAAPHQFVDIRSHFKRGYGEEDFLEMQLEFSFRSVPAVLEAVDTVFKRPEAFGGLTADPVETVHRAVRDTAPGLVEIWDIIKPDEKRDIEGWDAPFDTQLETSPQVKLAQKIAAAAKRWIARGVRVGDGDKRRLVTPGDILVLVRQRGALFEAIIRALKNAKIEVAGADRLLLTEHIAVMDLMVLADALLFPADDLALATVLRSPLFGFDDEQLFSLAWKRRGTLHDALRAARGDLLFAEAAKTLDRWTLDAQHKTPFAFYAHVLGPQGGRARTLARLGPEAGDALDEFLNLALDYERRETPSLQGFVAWLRASPTEVKRDMEIARDEVRVMTVHGAKGLEAPIVFLADAATPPAGPPQRQPRLLPLPPAHAAPGTPERLVWAGAKPTEVPPITAAKEKYRRSAADEHRRLLYVAMTRAADRLIVCGIQGERERPEGCWYDLVLDALRETATEGLDEDGGKLWRMEKFGGDEGGGVAAPVAASPTILPGWLTRSARGETPSAVVSPSTILDEVPTSFARASAEREQALLRGRLVHRLIQSLPDIAEARRREAAQSFLTRAGARLAAAEHETLIAQVLAVIADPRFAPLAGPGSCAEVPIVGRLARPDGPPLFVSGQVDRLAVTPEAVVIADYKTNRPAPRRLDEVPPSYLAQLALYRAVLAKLYPGRPVSALLVWTDVPDFMEISASALDTALAHVTAARAAS